MTDAINGPWKVGCDIGDLFWSVDTEGENSVVPVSPEGCLPVAMVVVPSAWGMDDVLDERAALLAAAPELLEALEEAIQELREVTEELIGEDYNSPKFNAVIAKAKGEIQ